MAAENMHAPEGEIMAGQFCVVVTAIDETWSLKQTVEAIMADNADDIREVIMAIASRTTAECRAAIDEMEAAYPGVVRRHEQRKLPGVGGANIECAAQARAPWVIMMASDLETPPERLREIIARAKQGDVDVVATSRWLRGGEFGDYNKVKLVCNWIFQKLYATLYLTALTDMTFGYRAYRRELFAKYRWQEYGHAFFMESICKFLRGGEKIAEIPINWRKRQEGVSHIQTSEFARYFRVGLQTRFCRKKEIYAQQAREEK